ncbi:MAG: hypothetical protein K0S76_2157 [Herbinix sp.]|jgi:signal transduction histidine kinase|nr:hypothetical protein [Herbinix sp.]
MMNQPFLYFWAKIAAVTASVFLFNLEKVDITLSVISTLGFLCVFLFELLIRNIRKKNHLVLKLTAVASVFACFILGLDLFFPLYVILLTHLIDITIDSNMFYQILVVVGLLSYLIFEPLRITTAISFLLLLMVLYCRAVIIKLEFYTEMSLMQKETIGEMNQKLLDLKSLMKTLKYTASIEERNRIAARIHDQIGHGISGSIIMLEAAMLVMKDNPEKAFTSIQKVTANLREGVDEIRAALREERAGRYLLGMNDVTARLEEFKVSYNLITTLKTTGNLDVITMEVWACIHDNLKECLTNVLKHSNASEFQLKIDVLQKIIKVEYKDNGKSEGSFEKGLGLDAIEERTVNAKGRCFFTKGETGFCVTNIFTF